MKFLAPLRLSFAARDQLTRHNGTNPLDGTRTIPQHLANGKTYYGWWIVFAAFLNLFLVVGVIFYGFPAFYPYFVQDLHFTRAQLTQGFLLGFLFAGLPFGIIAGALIDRVGARAVILGGVALVSGSLILMSRVTQFWQFELLCIVEVIGYVFAGPLSNQVLVAKWFERRRGQAMGYAYLGLGLGGVAAPLLVNYLARTLGWRPALEIIGAAIALVLVPTGLWITRSTPADRGIDPKQFGESLAREQSPHSPPPASAGVAQAVRTAPFWLILLGSTLAIGAIGAVIQHFILFLKDSGYSATVASRYLSILLTASLGGRVVVGYIADRFSKSFIMAIFYFLIGASVLLLGSPTIHRRHLGVRRHLRIFDGCRLHADPARGFRKFRHRLARQNSRPDHHGLFDRSVGRPMVRRQTLRRPSQLRPGVDAHRDIRNDRRSRLRHLSSSRRRLRSSSMRSAARSAAHHRILSNFQNSEAPPTSPT